MKGIILAGGSGTRLYPITKAVSKQILPIYDKPMIYYPLSCLMLAGIRDVLIISTPRDINLFKELFGDGSWLGMTFDYAVQDVPRGLADAFIVGKDFVGADDVALVLGDNIFFGQSFTKILKEAVSIIERKTSDAVIFGYTVKNPAAYGVVEFNPEGKVREIVEKPKDAKSSYAVPGLYFYNNSVLKIAADLKPSRRNELEITDVNNEFLSRGRLEVKLLGRGMTWMDAGTYDGLLDAGSFISTIQNRQGFYVGCIEEIACKNGWITKEQLLKIAESYVTEYGKYLAFIAKETLNNDSCINQHFQNS